MVKTVLKTYLADIYSFKGMALQGVQYTVLPSWPF